MLQTGVAINLPFFVPSFAQALNAESVDLEKGLLESRVLENVMSPPTYGLEGNDVYYPK